MHIRVIEIPQAFSLRFCILQVIKNWRCRRPGNEANVHTPVNFACNRAYTILCSFFVTLNGSAANIREALRLGLNSPQCVKDMMVHSLASYPSVCHLQ